MDAPSTTPHPQSLTLTYRKHTFKFVDTPGLSFIPAASAPALPSSSTPDAEDEELQRQTRLAHDILLRNRGNISKLNNPLPAASYIFHRAALADLLILYNLPAVPEGDLEAFLGSLARREGALHKRGAVIDLLGACRALVRDWKSGRLAWYTLPSSSLDKKEEGGEGGGDREVKVDEKLRMIYARDEKVLAAAGVLPRREIRRIRGGVVQLSCGKVDERAVDMEATVEVESDSDEAEVAFEPKVKGGILKVSKGKKKQPEPESDETADDQSGEDMEEDEEGASRSEEEDEMDVSEEMEALPVQSAKLSGKRKRDARKEDKDERQVKKVTFGPSPKSVSKSKPTATAPKKGAPKRKVANGGSVKKARGGLDDEDEYDFSRYF
jgi:nuclear GTP-binding protein